MNLTEILKSHAQRHGDQIAIVDRAANNPRMTTFREFDRRVDRLSLMFQRDGLVAGQSVLLLLPMSAELYTVLAAILRCGMTAMFINPFAGRQSIETCCRLRPPQAMVAGRKGHLLRLTSPAIGRIPVKYSSGGWVPGAHRLEHAGGLRGDAGIYDCDADSAALISFSSGNTGEPKTVVRSHGFLTAQHAAVERHLMLTPGETELVTMPLFVLANLASRVTSVMADVDLRRIGTPDPRRIGDQIRVHGVDRLTASPAFLKRLLAYSERDGLQFESLRRILTGGGPVSPSLLRRLQRFAPGADVVAVYGSSEAEPICTLRAEELSEDSERRVASGEGLPIGTPVDSLCVRVIRDQSGTAIDKLTASEFESICQPIDVPGEIVVAGNHVLDGYADAHLIAQHKIDVGTTRWHRTGDAGCFDASGGLWLAGRCSARICDDHGSVYPLVVEQAAAADPSVGNAALVSLHGKRTLAVEPCFSGDPVDLNAIRDRLAFAKIDSIKVLRSLPVDKRHQSKIDYQALLKVLRR